MDIMSKIKSRVMKEEPPQIAQVIETKVVDEVKDEGTSKETVIAVEHVEVVATQQLAEPKVIKVNDPGTPTMGFTLQVLADELASAIEKSMHKSNVSSLSASAFGIFHQAGVTPKGFKLVSDEYTGEQFYILKNSNRMTEVFKELVKAISITNSETISFAYTIETTLELPLKFNEEKGDFENLKVKTRSLYLTPDEIKSLNYKFIKEIQFCAKLDDIPESRNLLAMKIDRAEWKAAPYRVSV